MCSSYGDFIYVNCNAGFHVLTEQHHRSCCCKWKLQKEVISFICLVLFLYVDKQIFFCFLFEKEGKKWAWYLFMVTDTIVLKTWVLHPFQLLLGYAQTNPRIWFLSALLYYLGGSENWYFLIYNRRKGREGVCCIPLCRFLLYWRGAWCPFWLQQRAGYYFVQLLELPNPPSYKELMQCSISQWDTVTREKMVSKNKTLLLLGEKM